MRTIAELTPIHKTVAFALLLEAKRAKFDIQATSDLRTWQDKGLVCPQGPHQIDAPVLICSACSTLWVDPKVDDHYFQMTLSKFLTALLMMSEAMIRHLKRDTQRPIDMVRSNGQKE